MFKIILVLLIGVILFLVVLVVDIKLGVVEVLIGLVVKYGVVIKNGFMLVFEEINVKGGVNGDKLVLVIEDE